VEYIRELNAFDDWLETNPLDAITQTLWYRLMALANKCGWPEWFTVANITLQAKLGGISKATLNKHRQTLVDKGRIEYKSQGKQKAGKYRIISLGSKFKPHCELNHEPRNVGGSNFEPNCEPSIVASSNFDPNRELLHDPNREPVREPNSLPLLRQDKTKQDETKPTTSSAPGAPFRMFESEGFGMLSSVIADRIGYMVDDYGERWVCEAMKEAVVAGKRSLSYVNGILKRYKSSGVDEPWTVENKNGAMSGRSYSQTRNGKPNLSVVSKDSTDMVSPEELEEMRRLAFKLDGRQPKAGAR